ncbi:MFS transporter [Actinomadura barringtoniae]|uniref:MFS transporter n=1 Tax=Actinomadura barringtoniae TaxID=1427535 RepID=A0A939PF10_9ACTN|nr:MFS transporter [Actinomadura barringtoniae]MBO2448514.1 MFS transporter [Actinomadura barringtoniae]
MTVQKPVADAVGAENGGEQAGWWPLVAIVTAVSMLMMSATIVTVALPDIQRDLGADLTDLQWVVNSFTLATAVFQLTAGSLGDRVGRRLMFLIGVAGFGLASLACGLAQSPGVLIWARAAQGIAGAIMFATTLALVAQVYDGRMRGLAFGVRGAAAGVAVALGPLLGGALVAGIDWRWVFYVNIPFAIVTLLIGWLKLPREEELRQGKSLDVGGLVTLTASLILLMVGLLRGEDYGWSSARVIAMFAGAVVFMAAFIVVEAVHKEPMLDLSLFRSRSFSGTQLSTVATHGSFFALLVYLSLYFQNQLDYSAFKTGLCFLAVNIPILLAGPAAGAFMDRLPTWLLPTAGLALVGAGLVVMHGLTVGSSWTHLAPGMIIAGFGLGMALPAIGSLSMEVADGPRLGMAAGVNNTVSQTAMAMGIAIYGAILGRRVTHTMGRDLAGRHLPVHDLAGAASGGQIKAVAAHLPAGLRGPVISAAEHGVVNGLNVLFFVAAGVALTGAALSVILIRTPGRR